ncbi:hypothetical protein PN441_20530 [Spirulina major CS-329]|uniref:hypothetical protein n=1 Tax=Spirulina TaxID=1154 RepID=UPI00232E45F7|nr:MULTISPECIES: hypothetical protein [Spirulina]MDB9495829.1 hypothetical protein [Spirulina subsalsa CS-330]MDB9505472.1 hypothetical protein [Spirulina major CS-329]
MRLSNHHIQSCFLTALLSFVMPLMLIGIVLASSFMVPCLLGLVQMGHQAFDFVITILSTFGDGHPLNGSLVIATAFSFVGTLFYICTPYHQHYSPST